MTVDEKIEQIVALPDIDAAIKELDKEIDLLRVAVYRHDGDFIRKVESLAQEEHAKGADLFLRDFYKTWLRNGYAARQTCDALMQARLLLIRAKLKTKLAIRRQFPRPEARPLDNSELMRVAVARDEHPATYIPKEN